MKLVILVQASVILLSLELIMIGCKSRLDRPSAPINTTNVMDSLKSVQKTLASQLDSLTLQNFEHHLSILHAIKADKFLDPNLRAIESIDFFEKHTGIYGDGKVTFWGKETFTENDLKKWEKWFVENKHTLK